MNIRKIAIGALLLIIGVLSFAASELLYGSRGPDSGVVQFILYGLVGSVPCVLSSWLSHKYADAPRPVVQA